MIWIGVLFSFLAVLTWVISTLVVSKGIKELKENYKDIFTRIKEYTIKIEIIFTYLGITLLTGIILLSLAFIPLFIQYNFVFSGFLILAGIFSFSAGTGLYYFCTLVYQKAEIASQFSRIGPFFSIIFGVYIFGELFNMFDLVSLILLGIGITVFFMFTWTGKFGLIGFFLGILTSLSWTSGGIFMNNAFLTTPSNQFKPLAYTLISLLFGFLSLLLFNFIIMLINRKKKKYVGIKFQFFKVKKSVAKYFILHGILSTSIGFTLNFFGIFYLGVSGAAFIMSLWPILSLLVGYLLFSSSPEYLRYRTHIKWLFLIAVILLAASIISIF
ncbi:MAG: EamA family transporter [Candidatus Thorarchaeota archaeon]